MDDVDVTHLLRTPAYKRGIRDVKRGLPPRETTTEYLQGYADEHKLRGECPDAAPPKEVPTPPRYHCGQPRCRGHSDSVERCVPPQLPWFETCSRCGLLVASTECVDPDTAPQVVRDAHPSEPPRSSAVRLLALKENWDSYGAPIISKIAVDAALQLRNVLAAVPSFVPMSNGGVQLEWHSQGFDVELEIEPNGRLAHPENAEPWIFPWLHRELERVLVLIRRNVLPNDLPNAENRLRAAIRFLDTLPEDAPGGPWDEKKAARILHDIITGAPAVWDELTDGERLNWRIDVRNFWYALNHTKERPMAETTMPRAGAPHIDEMDRQMRQATAEIIEELERHIEKFGGEEVTENFNTRDLLTALEGCLKEDKNG